MTHQLSRRQVASLTLASAAGIVLQGCATGSQGAVNLETAKLWVSDLAGAVVAAAGSYSGPQASMVKQIAADLQTAAASFNALGDVATAKSAALSVLAFVQQLVPFVAPLLGPAAVFVPMAIGVIQAFVAALPAPPDTPPAPPAALHRAALARH